MLIIIIIIIIYNVRLNSTAAIANFLSSSLRRANCKAADFNKLSFANHSIKQQQHASATVAAGTELDDKSAPY